MAKYVAISTTELVVQLWGKPSNSDEDAEALDVWKHYHSLQKAYPVEGLTPWEVYEGTYEKEGDPGEWFETSPNIWEITMEQHRRIVFVPLSSEGRTDERQYVKSGIIDGLTDLANDLRESRLPAEEQASEPVASHSCTSCKAIEQWKELRTAAVSEMLDNPDENGIFQTTELFERLDKVVVPILEAWRATKNTDLFEDIASDYPISFTDAQDIVKRIFRLSIPIVLNKEQKAQVSDTTGDPSGEGTPTTKDPSQWREEIAHFLKANCDLSPRSQEILPELICDRIVSPFISQLEELRSWKRHALEVMPDMQEIGKLIGVPLGQSVHDKIIPAIKQLQAQLEAWEKALISLTPGGSEFVGDPDYCVKIVREGRDMDRQQIVKLTRELKEAQQKDRHIYFSHQINTSTYHGKYLMTALKMLGGQQKTPEMVLREIRADVERVYPEPMCGCQGVDFGSYSNQVNLTAPPHMIEYRKLQGGNPTVISVDACLAPEIKELWGQGITTTGCCCGHNKGPEYPYIGVIEADIPKMKEMGYAVQPNPHRPGNEDQFKPKSIKG